MAFFGYLALSIVLFGHGALFHPNSVCACAGNGDPTSFMWSFEWWPHAIFHGLNPFVPHVIWAPEGANLTQGGFALPAATLLMIPVTVVAGPMVSYNIVSVLLPALAAWFAYRLCDYMTGNFGAAFVGGLVFGFGTYMSAHLLGHLNLASVFLAPAAVLLVLQRLEGEISQRRFVVLMAVVFGVQVLLSAEMLLIGLLVGAFALLVAYAVADAERRGRIARLVPAVLAGGGLAMLVTSPFLYWTIHGLGDADSSAWKTFTDLYPGDALNPLLPTEVTWIGHSWFEDTTSKFTNFTPSEAGAYVGPVLLGIVVAFAITQWRRAATKVLLAVIAVCYVLSLGTELHVGGDAKGVWMPWAALHPLPVLDHVISTRFWALRAAGHRDRGCALAGGAGAAAGAALGDRRRRRAAADPEPVVGLLGRSSNRPGLLPDRRLQGAHPQGRARAGAALRPLREQHALAGARGDGLRPGRGLRVAEFPPDYRHDPFFGTLISGRVGQGLAGGPARLPDAPQGDRGRHRRVEPGRLAVRAGRARAEAGEDRRRPVLPSAGRLGRQRAPTIAAASTPRGSVPKARPPSPSRPAQNASATAGGALRTSRLAWSASARSSTTRRACELGLAPAGRPRCAAVEVGVEPRVAAAPRARTRPGTRAGPRAP